MIVSCKPDEIRALKTVRDLEFHIETLHLAIYYGNVSLAIDEFHNKNDTVTIGIRQFQNGHYEFIRRLSTVQTPKVAQK